MKMYGFKMAILRSFKTTLRLSPCPVRGIQTLWAYLAPSVSHIKHIAAAVKGIAAKGGASHP